MKYKICFFDHCVLYYAYEKFLCKQSYTNFNDAWIDRRILSIKYSDVDFFILEVTE